MIKVHCDRCDVVIDADTRAEPFEFGASFLADKGQINDDGPLRVTIDLGQYEGNGQIGDRQLCARCLRDLVMLVARQLIARFSVPK